MKKILWAVTVFYGAFALASHGGESGGGGNSVVCRNADGSIKSAEVLDLYEGRVVYDLKYDESADDWKKQVIRALKPIDEGTSSEHSISTWVRNAIQAVHLLPEGTALQPIHDSLEAIIPVGCEIRQTANYQNDHLILIDSQVWKALSSTQKAALVVHEGVYRFLRDHGESDSRRARHFTAHLFAGGSVESAFPGNDYLAYCGNGTADKLTGFYVFVSPENPLEARVQFAGFGGREFLSKKYADLNPTDTDGKFITPAAFAAQLVKPSKTVWTRYQNFILKSSFEPGDEFDLWLHDGIVQIEGISAFDGAKVGLTDLKCFSGNL